MLNLIFIFLQKITENIQFDGSSYKEFVDGWGLENDRGSICIMQKGEKINQNHVLWIKSLLDNL